MTMPRVFVSHSHQDNAWCRPFVAALRAAGYPCFYDEDSIPGSAPWVATIQREVGACAVFLLVLSPVAWESPWVQQELQLALAKLKPLLTVVRQPTPQADGFILIHQWVQALGMEGAAAAPLALQALGRFASPSPPVVAPPVQPIPVRSAPAPVAAPDLPGEPSRLLVPRPLAALGFQARLINGVDVILAPFDRVPAGDFIMGSDSAHDPNAQANEMPQYRLFLPDFELGRYPVTVAEYACMVRAGKAKEPQKLGEVDWAKQQQHPDHPVVCVTWQEATVYAQWLAQVTGLAFRLPTEAEWEKAARGTDGRIYPWGDQWDAARANTSDGGPRRPPRWATMPAQDHVIRRVMPAHMGAMTWPATCGNGRAVYIKSITIQK
jgi:hypothetical protein